MFRPDLPYALRACAALYHRLYGTSQYRPGEEEEEIDNDGQDKGATAGPVSNEANLNLAAAYGFSRSVRSRALNIVASCILGATRMQETVLFSSTQTATNRPSLCPDQSSRLYRLGSFMSSE